MKYEFDIGINNQYIFNSNDMVEVNEVLARQFEELGLNHVVANLYQKGKNTVFVKSKKSYFPGTYELLLQIVADDKSATDIKNGLLDGIDGLVLE